jgi:hypothetical protein
MNDAPYLMLHELGRFRMSRNLRKNLVRGAIIAGTGPAGAAVLMAQDERKKQRRRARREAAEREGDDEGSPLDPSGDGFMAGMGAPYLFQNELTSCAGPRVDGRLVRALERRREANRADIGLAGATLPDAREAPPARLLGADDEGGGFLRRVTIRSTFLPPGGVTFRAGGGAEQGGGGFGFWFTRQARLDVEAETPLGLARYAPHGRSNGELFPLVGLGTLAAGGGLLYLLVKGIATALRERRARRSA